MICKCLDGLAPSYLANDCVLALAAAGRRHLRSAEGHSYYQIGLNRCKSDQIGGTYYQNRTIL